MVIMLAISLGTIWNLSVVKKCFTLGVQTGRNILALAMNPRQGGLKQGGEPPF